MLEVTNLEDFELQAEKEALLFDLHEACEREQHARAVGDPLRLEQTSEDVEVLRARLRCVFEEQYRREQEE